VLDVVFGRASVDGMTFTPGGAAERFDFRCRIKDWLTRPAATAR
jgi:hypothetical protein